MFLSYIAEKCFGSCLLTFLQHQEHVVLVADGMYSLFIQRAGSSIETYLRRRGMCVIGAAGDGVVGLRSDV